jgi:hypothetical protein
MDHELTAERERVLQDVVLERAYQESRYSREHDKSVPLVTWTAILAKHLGRAAGEAVTHGATGALRHHLVRVAAVCVAAVEAMDNYATARAKR